MGLFSNVLKRVKEGVPQALDERLNPGFGIGSLTRRPDLEPRGGGFLKRAVSNNQRRGPQPSPMLPIMPPSIPGLNIPDLSALQNISPAVKDAVQQSLATGEPILSPERLQEMINQPPVAPMVPPPPKLPPNEPLIDVTNMGQSLLDSYDAGLNNFSPIEGEIRRRARDRRKPIPPQDFGFGPGIRPTEIRGLDGTMIGSAGVTPPDGARVGTDLREAGFLNMPELNIGPQVSREEAEASRRAAGAGRTDPGLNDFVATTGQEVFDKDYFDRIGIPDPRTNIGGLQTFIGNQGINPPPPPTPPQYSNMIAELPSERIAEIGDPIPVTDPVATPAPVTPPASTTVAANQPPVAPPAPTQPPATTTDGVGTAPAEPAPTTTTAPPQVPGGTPYAAGVTQVQSGLDPLTEQLLFGVGGQGGFIPGAMRAAEKVFYDDQGQPVVIDEQVAGFSPDQLAAMQLQRQSIGMQQPYLDQATQAYFSGLGALQSGVGESLGTAAQGVEDIARGVGEARGLREAGLRGLVGSLDEARGLTRGATDEFGRRISGVETGSQRAARQFARGLGRSQLGLERGVDQFGRRLTDVEGIQRGATGQFGARTAGIAGRGISDVGRFERGLQDPESLLRGSVGGYNQGLTRQFYDPFEERVVQQTIEDIMEQGAKSDIGARAGDIARGGESAFGSRARLGAAERTEALGRGLAEALGGIRSSGFQRAQQAGLSEFARQKEAERAAASGLAGLAGQRLGAGQQLTGMLRGLSGDQLAAQQALASGLGSIAGQRLGAGQSLAEFQRGTAGQQLASQQALQSMLRGTTAERLAAQQNLASTLAGLGTTQQQALSQAGQQALAGQQVLGGARTGLAGMQMGAGQALQQGQFGLGSSLQGLGAQAAGASASDIAALYGMGSQQQGMTQAQLDAQRRNLQQRQMTPLLQYQALAPFVSMAPAGQFQTTTQFAPKPSAMMTGIGTGLQAFGSLGNLYGGK